LLLQSGCGLGQCDEYASSYSCEYLKSEGVYEVWYWRDLQFDDESDNEIIGTAKGLYDCKANAMAFARAIGEEWNDRAYICVLIDQGERKEKHRLL
jgi:hypothetical protein